MHLSSEHRDKHLSRATAWLGFETVLRREFPFQLGSARQVSTGPQVDSRAAPRASMASVGSGFKQSIVLLICHGRLRLGNTLAAFLAGDMMSDKNVEIISLRGKKTSPRAMEHLSHKLPKAAVSFGEP